ncbi:MAG: hypothetical protein R6V67_03180 [Spirochaetia bacterium]
MRRNVIIVLIVMSVLMGGPVLFAGGAQEASGEDFPGRLETALENSSFSEEEVEEIAEKAAELSWEEAEGADAEVVARALSLAKDEDAELDAEQNARMALELAQNAVRLENENYEETVVAQATLESVRSMLGQIEEWKSGDSSESLGEIVRATVSTEARKAAQNRNSDKKKEGDAGRDKASEAASDTPAGDTSDSSAGEQ